MNNPRFQLAKYGWIGWIKSGRDKISARGPQIGPNVHNTDEKLRDQKETNRQTDRNRQYMAKY
jgi:hypothetical protein